MQIISLFSGIGGFEFAGHQLGWDTVVQCEINPFCQQVLRYHYPESYLHNDVKTLNYETIKEKSRWNSSKSTIVVGGFPCQPYSLAGKRLGKEDERHLWPEMLRVIQEIQPEWIVGENVFGLINWSGGLVFEEVQTDLETAGYEVQSYVLPACSVNAPHKRERIWIVAHSNNNRKSAGFGQIQQKDGEISERNEDAKSFNSGDGTSSDTDKLNVYRTGLCSGEIPQLEKAKIQRSTSPDTCNKGLQRVENIRGFGIDWKESNQQSSGLFFTDWEIFPTQSPVCERNDGLSDRLSGITFPKWRNESIKALGNAIVPQVVYQIFKAIENYEQREKKSKDVRRERISDDI